MHCHDPLPTLFNDFSSPEATRHASQLSWQPAGYISSIHVSYCAWREIPSVYLCCARDGAIPLEMQQQFAAMAGAEIESCDAGHMVMLSQPERVVEFVSKAAGEA